MSADESSVEAELSQGLVANEATQPAKEDTTESTTPRTEKEEAKATEVDGNGGEADTGKTLPESEENGKVEVSSSSAPPQDSTAPKLTSPPAEPAVDPDAMTAADYAMASNNANWRKGNSKQFKVLAVLAGLCGIGNFLLWLQADFMTVKPHSAPPFFATFLCCLLFAASARSSIYRGTLRSFATLILHNSLDTNVCATHFYFNLDSDNLTLHSGQVPSVTIEPAELRVIRAGCFFVCTAGLLSLWAAYADTKRFSKDNVGLGVANANGIIALIVSFFLALGSILLWTIEDVCVFLPNLNIMAPLMTFLVLLLSVLTNDFEARDLSFVYLIFGLITYAPIFTPIPTHKQRDSNHVYKAGISLIFIGVLLFSIVTMIIGIKRRGVRMINVGANKSLVGGLGANALLGISGAIMVWSQTDHNPNAKTSNYIAALAFIISVLQLFASLLDLPSVSLLILVLSPGLFEYTYPQIFSLTGTDRSANMMLTVAVATSVFLPMIHKAMGQETVGGKSALNSKSQPYFASGIVLVIAAWIGLTETDQTGGKAEAIAAKFALTSHTGYIGALLILSYATRSEDGLKMAFYLVGVVFMRAWPWALGYSGIEGTATILTFFALMYFAFRYVTELGDGAFLALTLPEQSGTGETDLESGEDAYQGEEYKPMEATAKYDEDGAKGSNPEADAVSCTLLSEVLDAPPPEEPTKEEKEKDDKPVKKKKAKKN